MHKSEIERIMLAAEEYFDRELAIVEEILGHPHPRHRHHRRSGRGEILFLFTFPNLQILQPMQVSKLIGPFTGSLVFKNTEGQVQPFSGLTGVVLSVGDATIGNAALNADGTFSGTGLTAGDLVLTANGTNDAGAVVTGTSTISFHADTTVTEVDVNID